MMGLFFVELFQNIPFWEASVRWQW